MKFVQMKSVSESELIAKQHEKEIAWAKAKVDMAEKDYISKKQELEDYRAETLKVIRGESKLSIDLLNSLVEEASTAAHRANQLLAEARQQLELRVTGFENIQKEYDRILNWADLYDNCSFEAKKMIVAQFIKAVRVWRDYEIEVDFNISFEDLQHYRKDQPDSPSLDKDAEDAPLGLEA